MNYRLGMKKIIILMGPPGSGKGTQAKKIAAAYGYGHISTGDLLRSLQKNPTIAPDELPALEEMKAGRLVPDWLIYRLAFRAIDENLATGKGVVLDGAIRNVAQAESYDAFFTEKNCLAEVQAIEIALPDAESFDRLAKRRICSVCGEIIAFADIAPTTCFKCGGALLARPDDAPEVVKKRITEQGNAAIEPLRVYYNASGRLATIDGRQPIAAVETELNQVLTVQAN